MKFIEKMNVSDKAQAEQILQNRKMTFDEYLDFLDEYWDIFGPIPAPKPKAEYKTVLL
jgi:hypothetical protein